MSKVIIQILENRDGTHIYTITEAMEQMFQDGMEEVVVQPTHIINGIENDIMIRTLKHLLQFLSEHRRVNSQLHLAILRQSMSPKQA
jgi:cobalamin biosynthesis Co2+ chelatase CbiK